MENYAKILGNIMWKKVPIMWKRRQMWKFLKLPRIKLLNDMFDLLLPFMDRYFFVQRSFSIVFSPKLSNLALNWMRKAGYWKSENYNPGSSPEDAWNARRFKIVYEQKGMFWPLFWVNNFFKMIISSLFLLLRMVNSCFLAYM